MQLSVKEAAKLLKVSEKTIYRWLNASMIPAYRINAQYRFNRTELLEWATARRIQVSPDIMADQAEEGEGLPDLYNALTEGGIYYRLDGSDKTAVLRRMAEVIKLPDEVDREFLVQVLLARESLSSTGIGDGIAIPHVRNPIVLHVTRPTVTLCFLETPIDFDAIDGKPVHALFTLISPTVRAHLHLLSRLAFALRDPRLKTALAEQAGREELLAIFKRIHSEMPKGMQAQGTEYRI